MASSKRKTKKKEARESKLLYIPFIALIVVMIIIFVLPMIHSPSATTSNGNSLSTTSSPFFTFAKVSNQNYAGNNSVEVYFISWYGCTYGATDSWGLYIALSHYGTLNVTPNYSDEEEIPVSPTNLVIGKVPGLIFNSFKPNSNVYFHAIYLLGRIYPNNDTASLPNGTIISYSGNSLVNLELAELKSEAPSWVYNLVYKYEIQTPFGQEQEGIAYQGHPPHIATTIIITGPNGTWMLLGYDQQIDYGMPGQLAQYAALSNYNPSVPQIILKDIQENNVPSQINFIELEGNQILNIINEAE